MKSHSNKLLLEATLHLIGLVFLLLLVCSCLSSKSRYCPDAFTHILVLKRNASPWTWNPTNICRCVWLTEMLWRFEAFTVAIAIQVRISNQQNEKLHWLQWSRGRTTGKSEMCVLRRSPNMLKPARDHTDSLFASCAEWLLRLCRGKSWRPSLKSIKS